MLMGMNQYLAGRKPESRALGELSPSRTARILSATDPETVRLLVLLGLLEDAEIRVVAREAHGGVTLDAGGRRLHIGARFVQRIWVQPDAS